MNATSIKRYAWLSIVTAIATIVLKALAWRMTGSIGLLSDALESIVNLAGAMMALAMISLAEQPADERHAYGHGKAEYFSAGFEGLLILIAALAIGFTAVERLFDPHPLERVGIGLAVSVVASLLNLLTARVLLSAGKKYRSLTLEADAHHLLTDVWTSVGVIGAVAAVTITDNMKNPAYKGLIQMPSPQSSGTAYSVILTLLQQRGEDDEDPLAQGEGDQGVEHGGRPFSASCSPARRTAAGRRR